MKLIYFVLAAVTLLLLAYAKGCEDGRGRRETVTVRDTVRIAPLHDTLTAMQFIVRTRAGMIDTVTRDSILRVIDTVFRNAEVSELTACADSVARGDTLHVCYGYVSRRFDIAMRFAPRVHDTVLSLSVSPQESRVFSWSPYFGGDVDDRAEWFGGAGIEATLGPIELSGALGVRGGKQSGISAGLRASARAKL